MDSFSVAPVPVFELDGDPLEDPFAFADGEGPRDLDFPLVGVAPFWLLMATDLGLSDFEGGLPAGAPLEVVAIDFAFPFGCPAPVCFFSESEVGLPFCWASFFESDFDFLSDDFLED